MDLLQDWCGPSAYSFLYRHGEEFLALAPRVPVRTTVQLFPLTEANEALIKLLAQHLDCPRNRVELVRGHKSRHKIVKLHGFTPEEALKRL